MKRILFILAILLGIPGIAHALPQSRLRPVVKITSMLCQNPTMVRKGSGVIVQSPSGTFVLTSSHVPFHANVSRGVCHSIEIDSVKIDNVTLLSANVLLDLALLRIDQPIPASIASVAVSIDGNTLLTHGINDILTSVGYPFLSKVPQEYVGIVSDWTSHRTTLALTQVVEIMGLSEFGMSGGGVFAESGRFEGILSHQFLSVDDQNSVTIGEFNQGAGVNGMLLTLAIPAEVALGWTNEILQGRRDRVILEDFEGQLRGQKQVALDGILFREVHCTGLATHNDNVSGNGAAVGGQVMNDGFNAGPCKIEISPRLSSGQTSVLHDTAGFQRIRASMAAQDVWIIDAVSDGRHTEKVESLLHLWSRVSHGWIPSLKRGDVWRIIGSFDLQGPISGGRTLTPTVLIPATRIAMSVPWESQVCGSISSVTSISRDVGNPEPIHAQFDGTENSGREVVYYWTLRGNSPMTISSLQVEAQISANCRMPVTFQVVNQQR